MTSTTFYLTRITIAELWQSIGKLDPSHPKRPGYLFEITLVEKQFESRILDFDRMAARLWGEVRGEQMRQRRTFPELDMQIAAIALHHDMAVATANIRHFSGLGIELVNPLAHT